MVTMVAMVVKPELLRFSRWMICTAVYIETKKSFAAASPLDGGSWLLASSAEV